MTDSERIAKDNIHLIDKYNFIEIVGDTATLTKKASLPLPLRLVVGVITRNFPVDDNVFLDRRQGESDQDLKNRVGETILRIAIENHKFDPTKETA